MEKTASSSLRQSKDKDIDVFQSRKNSFLRSLKSAILKISDDKLLAQMVGDPLSSQYIPDRVVEIIQQTLQDDREKLIMSLLKKISISSEQTILSSSSQQMSPNKQRLSNININDINNKTNDKNYYNNGTNKQLMNGFRSIKSELSLFSQQLDDTKHFFLDFKRNFINNDIQKSKLQVDAFVTASIAGRNISATNSSSLQKELNFLSKKFYENDIPNIQKKFEMEINEHILNEEKLLKENMQLKRQNEKLEKKNYSLLDKLKNTEKSIELLKMKIKSYEDIQQQVSAAKGQIKALQKELETKNNTINGFVSEKSDDSVSIMKSSYASLKQKLNETEKENMKLRETLSSRNLSEKDLENKNSVNQLNLDILKSKNSSIPQLENDLKNSQRRAKSLEIANIEIAKRLEKSISDQKELYKTINELKDELSSKTNDRNIQSEMRSEIELLNEELSACRKHISDLDSNIFELSQQNSKLKKENDNKTSVIDQNSLNFSSSKSKLQSSLAASETKVSFLSSKLKEYESSMHSSLKNLRQKELKLSDLSQSKIELENLSNSLREKLEQKEIEYKQTSLSFEQTSEAYLYAKEELKQKDNLIQKLLLSDEIYQNNKLKMTNKIENDQITIQKLNTSIHELSNEKEDLLNMLTKKEENLKDLTENVFLKEEKIKSKNDKIKFLNNSVNNLRKQIKMMENSQSESERVISDLREKIASNEMNNKKLDDLNNKLKEEKKNWSQEKKNLQKKLSTDKVNFEAKIDQLEKENIVLTKEKTDLELKLDNIIKNNEENEKKLNDNLIENNKTKNENLKVISENNNHIEMLKKHIVELQQQNNHYENKIVKLIQTIQDEIPSIKIKKIHEIPAKLKEIKEKLDMLLEEDANIRKILKITEFESKVDSIFKLKGEAIKLQKFDQNVRNIIGNFKDEKILFLIKSSYILSSQLSNLLNIPVQTSASYNKSRITKNRDENGAYSENEEEENNEGNNEEEEEEDKNEEENNIFENDDNIIQMINNKVSLLSIFESREKIISKILNNSDEEENKNNKEFFNEDLPMYLTSLQNKYRNCLKILKKLGELFVLDNSLNNQSNFFEEIPTKASIIITQLQEVKKILQIDPDNDSFANLTKSASLLYDQLKEKTIELKSIKRLFPKEPIENINENDDVFTNGANSPSRSYSSVLPITKQIEILFEENRRMKFILQKSSEALLPDKTYDSIDINNAGDNNNNNIKSSPQKMIKKELKSPNSEKIIKSLKKKELLFQKREEKIFDVNDFDIESANDFISKCHQLRQKVELMERQQIDIERLLPQQKALIGSLPEKVSQISKNYSYLSNQLNEIQTILNDKKDNKHIIFNFETDSLPNSIGIILTKFEEFERQERLIFSTLENFLDGNNNDISQIILEIVTKNHEQFQTLSKIHELFKKDGNYENQINDKNNSVLIGKIENIINENYEQRQKLQIFSEILSANANKNNSNEEISNQLGIILQNHNFLYKIKNSFECKTNDEFFAKITVDKQTLKILLSLIPSDFDNFSDVYEKMSNFTSLLNFKKELLKKLSVSSEKEVFDILDNYSMQISILEKLKNDLDSKILPRNLEGSIQERTEQIVKQCLLYQRQYNQLKKLVPSGIHGSLSSKIEQIVNILQKYQNQQDEIKRILDKVNFNQMNIHMFDDSDDENDIQEKGENNNSFSAKINQMRIKLNKFIEDNNKIKEVIPEEFSGNDQAESVQILTNEFNKQKASLLQISSLLSSNNILFNNENSLEENIYRIIVQNKELVNEKNDIYQFLSVSVSKQNSKKFYNNFSLDQKSVSIIELIKIIMEESARMKKLLDASTELLSCNEDDLVKTLMQLSSDSLLLKNAHQSLNINSSFLERLNELKSIHATLNMVESALPDNMPSNYSSVQSKVAFLSSEYQEKTSILALICKQYQCDNQNINMYDTISHILLEREEFVRFVRQISQILDLYDEQKFNHSNPINSSLLSQIVSSIKSILESNKQLSITNQSVNDKLKEIPGNLNSKVSEILRQNNILQKNYSDISRIIPENINGDDIVEKVQKLSFEYNEFEVQQIKIMEIIPVEISKGTLYDKINEILMIYNNQKKLLNMITQKIGNEAEGESILEKIGNIIIRNNDLTEFQLKILNLFNHGNHQILNIKNYSKATMKNEEFFTMINEQILLFEKTKIQNNDLKRKQEEILLLINSNFNNYDQSIKKDFDSTNSFEFIKKFIMNTFSTTKMIQRIMQLLQIPIDEDKSSNINKVFDYVQKLYNDFNKCKNEKQSIKFILSQFDLINNSKQTSVQNENKKNSDEIDVEIEISQILQDYKEKYNFINLFIAQLIPDEITGNDISQRMKNFLKKYNDLKEFINFSVSLLNSNQITDLNENNNNGNPDKGKIIYKDNISGNEINMIKEKIEYLIRMNMNYRKERKTIISNIPINFQKDYPESLSVLFSEYNKNKTILRSIGATLFGNGSIENNDESYDMYPSKIDYIQDERNSLMKLKNNLIKRLKGEDVLEHVDRLITVEQQLKFINEKIPKIFRGSGIEGRIQSFIDEFQRKDSVIDRLNDILPGNGDLVKRAQILKQECLNFNEIFESISHAFIKYNFLFPEVAKKNGIENENQAGKNSFEEKGKFLVRNVFEICKKMEMINSLFENENNKKDIEEEISKLIKRNKIQEEKLNQINSIIPVEFCESEENDKNSFDRNEVEKVKKIVDDSIRNKNVLLHIESLIPGDQKVTQKIEAFIRMNEKLNHQINALKNTLLNIHFENEDKEINVNGDAEIEDILYKLIKEHNSYKTKYQNIKETIDNEEEFGEKENNDDLNNDSYLIEKIEKIQIEKKQLKEKLKLINNKIPNEFNLNNELDGSRNDDSKFFQKLDNFVDDYQQKAKFINNMDEIIPPLNNPNKNIAFLDKNLDKRIRNLIEEKQEYEYLIEKLSKLIPQQFKTQEEQIISISFENQFVKFVQNYQENLKIIQVLEKTVENEGNVKVASSFSSVSSSSLEKKIKFLIDIKKKREEQLKRISTEISKEVEVNENDDFLENSEIIFGNYVNKFKEQNETLDRIDDALIEYGQKGRSFDKVSKVLSEIKERNDHIKTLQRILKGPSMEINTGNEKSYREEFNNVVDTLKKLLSQKEENDRLIGFVSTLIPPEFSKGHKENINKSVLSLVQKYEYLKNLISKFRKLVKNSEDDDFGNENDDEIYENMEKMKNDLEKIINLIPSEFESNKPSERLRLFSEKYRNIKNLLENDNQTNNGNNVEDQIKLLKEKTRQQNMAISKINETISASSISINNLDNGRNVVDKVDLLKEEYEKLKDKMSSIEKIVFKNCNSDDKTKDVTKEISKIIERKENLSEEISKLSSLIPNNFVSKESINRQKNFVSEYNQQNELIQNLSETIGIHFREDLNKNSYYNEILDKVHVLFAKSEIVGRIEEATAEIEDEKGDFKQADEKVESVVKNYVILKKEIKEICSCLSIKDNNVTTRVSESVAELKEKFDNTEKSLQKISDRMHYPEFNGDISEKYHQFAAKYDEQAALIRQISNQLNIEPSQISENISNLLKSQENYKNVKDIILERNHDNQSIENKDDADDEIVREKLENIFDDYKKLETSIEKNIPENEEKGKDKKLIDKFEKFSNSFRDQQSKLEEMEISLKDSKFIYEKSKKIEDVVIQIDQILSSNGKDENIKNENIIRNSVSNDDLEEIVQKTIKLRENYTNALNTVPRIFHGNFNDFSEKYQQNEELLISIQKSLFSKSEGENEEEEEEIKEEEEKEERDKIILKEINSLKEKIQSLEQIAASSPLSNLCQEEKDDQKDDQKDDLQNRFQDIIRDYSTKSQNMAKVSELLLIKKAENENQINDNLIIDKVKEIMKSIPSKFENDFKSYSEDYDQKVTLLNTLDFIVSGDQSITEKVTNLSSQLSTILSQIPKEFLTESENNSNGSNEIAAFDLFVKAYNDLKDIKEKYESVRQKIDPNTENIIESVEEIVSKLPKDMQSLPLCAGVTKFFEFLLTSFGFLQDGTTTNGIDSLDFSEKLKNLIKYAKNCEEIIKSTEMIKKRAQVIGFVGQGGLLECVEFLEKSSAMIEKQKGLEEMQKELRSVRDLQSKESETNEKMKTQLKTRLEEQRRAMQKAQEAGSQRVEELLGELDEEQKSNRQMQNDIEKLQKVRDELVRCVLGKAIDIEVLQNGLDESDFSIIEKKLKKEQS